MSIEEQYPLVEESDESDECDECDESNELPDDKVLVTTSNTGGGRSYHTDPDCRYVTDKHREWDKDIATSWYEECTCCADSFPWNK